MMHVFSLDICWCLPQVLGASGYHLGTMPYNLMTDPASLQVQHPLQKGGKGKPLHLHPAVEHRIDLSAGLCVPLATVAAAQHLQGVRS